MSRRPVGVRTDFDSHPLLTGIVRKAARDKQSERPCAEFRESYSHLVSGGCELEILVRRHLPVISDISGPRLMNMVYPKTRQTSLHSLRAQILAMSRAAIEKALHSLLPRYSGVLPSSLVDLSSSLVAQSRSRASALKPDEEVARLYACANLACERYVGLVVEIEVSESNELG